MQVKILHMPTKSRKLHPCIHPRNCYPADFIFLQLNYPQQRIRRLIQIVQVVKTVLIVEVRVQPIMNFAGRKPATILRRGQVSSVLYSHSLLLNFIAETVHFGLVTKFQYSCSSLDSIETPRGDVLNLYRLAKLLAFSLNSANLRLCTFCSKGQISQKMQKKASQRSINKPYLSMFQLLKSLNPHSYRTINVSKGKRTIPSRRSSQLYCPIIRISSLQLFDNGQRIRIHLFDSQMNVWDLLNSIIRRVQEFELRCNFQLLGTIRIRMKLKILLKINNSAIKSRTFSFQTSHLETMICPIQIKRLYYHQPKFNIILSLTKNMGIPIPNEEPPTETSSKNMQKYYSETYHQYVSRNENVAYSSKQVVGSIYSKARVPTDTYMNRDLALLDIDKLISLSSGSLDEQGDRVKYMRMVAKLMEQATRQDQQANESIQELVRMARLHFASVQRRTNREQSLQELGGLEFAGMILNDMNILN